MFGRAVERATKPERFIVGCADPARPLPAAYATLLGAFDCPILPMRYESAELAKIAINCCLVASVSVANTLADLSERIGADWHEIAPALRLDRRIGPHSYLAPGLGIAGGNLERDLATVLRLSEATGSEASVIAAFVNNSRIRRDWVLATDPSRGSAPQGGPHFCNSGTCLQGKYPLHEKFAVACAHRTSASHGRSVSTTPSFQRRPLNHPTITASATALEAARGSDALLIMTPWPEFRALAPAELASVMSGRTIIDPFRVLEPTAVRAAGLSYFTLGAPSLEAMGNS